MKNRKSTLKMQIKKRDCQNLTDVRTVIAMNKHTKYRKFPNHQRVKVAIFESNHSWQERIAWMDRIIDWTGPRGENFEWQCILHNSNETANDLRDAKSNRILGDKNPAYNHGGKLSPFSDKFIGKTTKDNAIAKMKSSIAENPSNQNTRIEYYLVKGMGLCEAIRARKKRQAVGSLDALKDRYGDEVGLLKWKERQEKWLSTMNSKSSGEIARINATKLRNGYSVSKAEKELFSKLRRFGADRNLTLSYNDGNNYYVYDIFKDNKIIEYNGDFWHANPDIYDNTFYNSKSKMSAEEIWEKELHKDSIAKFYGCEIMKVWESDYKKNPQKEIEKCLTFLTA